MFGLCRAFYLLSRALKKQEISVDTLTAHIAVFVFVFGFYLVLYAYGRMNALVDIEFNEFPIVIEKSKQDNLFHMDHLIAVADGKYYVNAFVQHTDISLPENKGLVGKMLIGKLGFQPTCYIKILKDDDILQIIPFVSKKRIPY